MDEVAVRRLFYEQFADMQGEEMNQTVTARLAILIVMTMGFIAGCQYDQHTAPESPPAPEIGRYEFVQTDFTMTRYDTVTGDVAVCEFSREGVAGGMMGSRRYYGDDGYVEFTCYDVEGLGDNGVFVYRPSTGEWSARVPEEAEEDSQATSTDNPGTE